MREVKVEVFRFMIDEIMFFKKKFGDDKYE